MQNLTWPKYQAKDDKLAFLKLIKNFFADKKSLIAIGNIVFLLAIYFLGTRLALPFVRAHQIQQIIQSSTLLSVVNSMLTGGALGNGSPFALGVLPLLFFSEGHTAIVGSRLRVPVRLTLRAWLAIILFAVLATLWYMSVGAIAHTVLSFLETVLCFIVGTFVLFLIESRLTKLAGLDIIYINAAFVLVSYLHSIVLVNNLMSYVIVMLIICFTLFAILLLKKMRLIRLISIKEEKLREGILPIPATDSLFQVAILFFTFIAVLIIVTVINLFSGLRLSPLGTSWPDVLVLLLLQLGIYAFFTKNIFIDALLSRFNSYTMAKRLLQGFWIIAAFQMVATKEYLASTTRYLTEQALRTHRLTYVFFLCATLGFALPGLISQVVHIQMLPMPFGPLGFVIIMTLCVQLVYTVFDTIQKYIHSVKLGNLGVVPYAASVTDIQPFLLDHDLEDLINRLSPYLTEEEREDIIELVISLKSNGISGKDALILLRKIIKRRTEYAEVSVRGFLLKLLSICVIDLGFTAVAAWIIQLVNSNALNDLGWKEALLLFFLGTFIAFIPIVGVDQLVKVWFKALIMRLRHRQQSTPSVGDIDKPVLGSLAQPSETFAYQIAFNKIVFLQREIIGAEYRVLLTQPDLHPRILFMIREEIARICKVYIPDEASLSEEKLEQLLGFVERWVAIPEDCVPEDISAVQYQHLKVQLTELVIHHYEERARQIEEQQVPLKAENPDMMVFTIRDLECSYSLRVMDRLYSQYFDDFYAIYENMRLRALELNDFIDNLQQKADEMLHDLHLKMRFYIVDSLLRALRNDFTITIQKPKR